MISDTRSYWDEQAEGFDDAADHGLVDPAVREAWVALLLPLVPGPGSDVADPGCGTGSPSLLLGGAGHRVRVPGFSERIVDIARAKTERTGVSAGFVVGDASFPPFAPGSFDAVLARHVLWALPIRAPLWRAGLGCCAVRAP